MEQRRALRALMSKRRAVLAPGVYDGLSAKLTQAAGFDAIYMSGAAVSAVMGLPDLGLVSQAEMAGRVQLITASSDLPLIADADTGFGDILSVHRTVQLYEAAGAAAIQIEDQEFPKKCGHLDDKRVLDAAEFATKIEAAVDARRDPETVIIARTDCRAALGFDEAVRRLNLYADAGADMLFLEAPQSLEEIRRAPELVSAPLLFNLVPAGKSPTIGFDELAAAQYAVVILPGLTLGPAVRAMREALSTVAGGEMPSGGLGPHALFDAVDMPYWEGLRKRFDKEVTGA